MESNVLIIFGVPLGIIVFVIIISYITAKSIKRKEYSNWKIGDWVRFKDASDISHEFTKPNTHFQLLGWDKESVYIKSKDGSTRKLLREHVAVNKSQLWRENYENCKKYMGISPGFTSDLMLKQELQSTLVYGKDVELLTETECRIYLKKALENEDYEIAEIIREKLQNFG